MANIKVTHYEDKERYCECCGERGNLFWVAFRGKGVMLPNTRTSIWLCENCLFELKEKIKSAVKP